MQALCFALFACAFNLLIGYVGLLSFGHAMFLGSAGYVTAHALKVWGLPPELAFSPAPPPPPGSASSPALVAIRRQGIYFAMITLALSQMVYFFYLQAPFTHGEDGIQAFRKVICSAFSISPTRRCCITSSSSASCSVFWSSSAPSTHRSARC